MSFESIGLNLVNQSDFELLEVVSEDITMRAQRVSYTMQHLSNMIQ